MEYPHRRYIRFLLSKRLPSYEVVSECLSKALLPPNDEDLQDLVHELGAFPSTWTPQFDPSNRPFKKWLTDHDLFELWVQDAEVQEAIFFLANERVRKAFESLMLLHGDTEVCRTELQSTFSERMIPSSGALEMYCYLFYDIGEMSKTGLFEYIQTLQDEEVKLKAYGGQLELTYAMLGLRQRVEGVAFLDAFIQMAHLTTLGHLRAGGVYNGATAAGASALGRAAMDAIAMREELARGDGESTLKKDAAIFKARIQHKTPPTISIDELRGDVYDADSGFQIEQKTEGGGAVVHRLPARSTTRKAGS